MTEDRCMVSVIVVMYNPQWEKLLKTLESALMQKEIHYEIVIADDGSPADYFEEIKKLFQDRSFSKYAFIKSPVNQGTVKNFLNAVAVSQGTYVKGISPGDFFAEKDTLQKWMLEMERTGCDWSFGDAVYYKMTSRRRMETVRQRAHPQVVHVYEKGDADRCRWNYLVNDDICLGAAVLSRRDKTLEYLNRIKGKVTYAEDNIYRLMMFDGLKAMYYSCEVIFYEFGEGISTSGDCFLKEKLRKDWKAASAIMEEYELTDQFQHDVLDAMRTTDISNTLVRWANRIFIKGVLKFKIRTMLRTRKTRMQRNLADRGYQLCK